MTNDFQPLLDVIEAICPLPKTELAFIVDRLQWVELAKGDFFLRPARPATQIGFLVSGLIRYFYVSDEGKEFTKHFCVPGHFVSSYASLAAGTSSDYWIEALEPTRLIVFRYQDWLELLHRHTVWGVINGRLQAQALILAERRERSLILDSALTRYRNLLEEFPGVEARIKQYDLASYLGITPVALSRIRGRPAKN